MAGKAYVSLYMKDKLTRDLRRAKANVNKFGADMMSLGTKMVAMSAAIATPIAFATKTFAGFDDAMRAVKAVTGATGDQFEMLTGKAKELGRTTSFTAIQVAELMTELGRAGFRPEEIDRMTGAVMNLARATGTDAAMSAGIMSSTLRQFALDAGEAARVADVLTKAANSTFNTVEGLGQSLEYAGPIARELGLSLEDTVAILGSLGNVGIQGSNAGTALRRLGVIAAANGKQLKKIFDIDNTDAAGKLKPLTQVMDEIGKSLDGLPVAEKMAKMKQAFGLLGITAASVMTGAAGGTSELADALRDAEGSAASAAKEMDSGLGGAFRIIMSAAEGLQIAIGEALSGSIKGITETITTLIGKATEWVGKNQELVTMLAAVTIGVGAAGVALITFGLSAKIAAIGLGILASVLAAIKAVIVTIGALMTGGGVLAVIAGAAALAAVAGMDFSDAWGVAKTTLSEFMAIAQKVGGVLMSALSGGDYDIAFRVVMAGLKIALAEAIDGMWALWKMFWKGAWNLANGFFSNLLTLSGKVVSALAKALSDPMKADKGDFAKTMKNLLSSDLKLSVGIDTHKMRIRARAELEKLERELEERTAARQAENEANEEQQGENPKAEPQANTAPKDGADDPEWTEADAKIARLEKQIRDEKKKLAKQNADAEMAAGEKLDFKSGGASAATFSARSLISMGQSVGEGKQVKAILSTKQAIELQTIMFGAQSDKQIAAIKKTTLKHT